MSSATIAAAQVVIVALLVLIGQWVVARYSKKANDTTVAVQQDANAVSGFHQLVTDLQGDIARLRADHDQLRNAHRDLEQHVQTLERERIRDRSTIRFLVEYVRTLIAALRSARLPVPEAPAGLDLEGGPLA